MNLLSQTNATASTNRIPSDQNDCCDDKVIRLRLVVLSLPLLHDVDSEVQHCLIDHEHFEEEGGGFEALLKGQIVGYFGQERKDIIWQVMWYVVQVTYFYHPLIEGLWRKAKDSGATTLVATSTSLPTSLRMLWIIATSHHAWPFSIVSKLLCNNYVIKI